MVLGRNRSLACLAALLIASLVAACGPIIAEYSLEAYKTATTLKAETLGLIDKSGDKIAKHQPEVDAVTTKINAAYEFAAGQPANSLSAQEWEILRRPEGGLYGGFLRAWREGPLPPKFRDDEKKLIGRAFDKIICLEVNKKDSQSCASIATRQEEAAK